MSRWLLPLTLVACSAPTAPPPRPPVSVVDVDPDGPHRAAVTAQVKPYLDGEIVTGLVIGLYDVGKLEIYGFGTGPGNKPPDGQTLFEIGSVTKVYTGLLLADAVQRREVELDTPVAALLPTGVTVPIRDKIAITLRHLVLHSSGLPRLPPSVVPTSPDPYASYSEDTLYKDLIRIELDEPPGTKIEYSNFGVGLLGFALGRKLGVGYTKAVTDRVIGPLGLRDTTFAVPAAAAARRIVGTNEDLQPVPPWNFGDTLAGAGGLISTVRDQLKLVAAELDAAAGGKAPLEAPMRLTQEGQLEGSDDNEGFGWQIDRAGRHWHNGGTGGFRSFVAFDVKTRRGIVILASTGSALVEWLGPVMFDVLDKTAKPPAALPTPANLTTYAGTYDFGGTKLSIVTANKRLYLEGPDEPRHRMAPISEQAFWIEALQSVAVFQKDEQDPTKIARIVFRIGDRQLVAPRVP